MTPPTPATTPRRLAAALVLVPACVGALLLGGPDPADAQSREHGPTVLTLPGSPASLALGGAFPVAGSSSDAVFVHPGVLGGARGIRLGLQRWGPGATLADASGAREWGSGGVAVGVRALARSAPEGELLPASGEDGLFPTEAQGVSELVAAAGFGHAAGPVQLGGAAKWIVQRTGGAASATAAVDVGASVSVLDDGRVALAVQNLGPALERDGRSLSLPRRIRLDASVHEVRLGPLDAGAAAAVIRRSDGEIVPAAGVELAWWPVQGRTFVGRAGIRRVPEGDGNPVSLGAAFRGDSIVLEYAYRPFGETGATHRFGLGWRPE